MYNMIPNHIFSDGNKQIGLDACILFLNFNQFKLRPSVTNTILTNFIPSIAMD